MEGSADLQGDDFEGSGFDGFLTGFVDANGSSGDNHLTGAIKISGHHPFGMDAGTNFDHPLVVQSQNRRHGRRLFFAGFLHGRGPQGHEAQSVPKVQGPGSGQGRKFSQGMPGDHRWLKAFPQDFGPNHGVQENGRLGHLGGFEIFFAAIAKEAFDGIAQDFGGLIQTGFGQGIQGQQIAAHAGVLGSLSRKEIGAHRLGLV